MRIVEARVEGIQVPGEVVRRALAGLLVASPLGGILLLVAQPSWDVRVEAPVAHFYVVTLVSLVGFGLSAAVLRASRRVADARALWLGLGFLSISGFFLVHALTTPHVLVGPNATVGLAARLSLLVGAVAFALSAVPWGNAWNARLLWVRGILLAVFVVGILAFGAGSFLAELHPRPAPSHAAPEAYGGYEMPSPSPSPESPRFDALSALVVLLFGGAAWRYLRDYRTAGLPAHAALAAGLVFLGEAQVSMTVSPTWALSWWAYHGLVLGGFASCLVGFGGAYNTRGSLGGLLEVLFAGDLIDRIESGYSEAVFALVAAMEARDPYTHGHSARVAQLAVLIGEAMHLPPEVLRSLGRAGRIHDIGKIAIPDHILRKPGPLTEEEYVLIRQHPRIGHDIVRQIPSLRRELPAILYHHEWYDGRGYPEGLAGERIPLSARILAVADVYDALTSERPYRRAWTHERAVAHIRNMAGSQFDPRCVEAFLQVVDRWRARQAVGPDAQDA
ncbi:MAG: HD domain-containing phosphohydrolase [Armatimonadota bacterium]|nr:HD domain-containing phosphohydrolase [Armatimonadota bacterium]MDR7445064.1 HD domain-containing phosphohydrolase [Armatimonadota bacterium]MDR7569849.1 HD domain-containing phosphohydrolase [Armatimonadota bacterium]MDR7614150.1 HD domain-containing phosphohydrolase [Armatimonadota bacterium]